MRLHTTFIAAAFALAACDNGTSDDSSLEVAGFALSADDESDDGFDENADTTGLDEAVGEDLDAGEAPLPEETDPAEPEEGRVARTVLVLWGQPRSSDASEVEPTVWAGTISSDVASVRVLRTFRFERAAQGDHLVRDDGDPNSIGFSTTTTTHLDGVLLRVVAPRNPASLEGELTFATDHFTQSVGLGSLLAGEDHRFVADAQGNVLIVATALPHACEHGMLRLGWQRVDRRGGVFGGKVLDDAGEVQGHVVGIWGTVAGKNRFKGIYRAADGSYRGTVRGAWSGNGDGSGTFRGMWTVAGRVHGVMGGVFEVGDRRGRGTAHGFWRKSCEADGESCGDAVTLPPAEECVAPEDPAE